MAVRFVSEKRMNPSTAAEATDSAAPQVNSRNPPHSADAGGPKGISPMPCSKGTAMKIFAPKVFVIGDTIYAGDQDVAGKRNPPQAAQKYETDLLNLRDQIVATPFGTRWLEIVGNNKEPIVIVPSTDTNNAVTQTFPNTPDHPARLADGESPTFTGPGGVPGTGLGTPARIKFNPAAVTKNSSGFSLDFSTASGAVLLVHELTHAYRMSGGRATPVAMTGLVNPKRERAKPDLTLRFPDWEEFLATVVENVFAAELGKDRLRMNWDTAHPAAATGPAYFTFWQISPPSETDSQGFARDYQPAILRILQVESPLYTAMNASNAWFNPVRDFEKDMLGSRK
jgi:hypothetical protein